MIHRSALALALSSATASTYAATPEFVLPPYAGVYEPQGVDERGLWMEMDEDEKSLRDFPGVLKDEKLNAYVRGVLCRTVGQDRCHAARIYIVQEAVPNASMAPNGLMIVHTGMLARLQSEAELAMVLGHEFGHFEQRHSLAKFRQYRTATDIISWISLAGAVTNTDTRSSRNTIWGSFFRYNRSQETEADLLSVKFIAASPYRLQASAIWRRSIEENDALRTERGQRKVHRKFPGFAETHPTDAQRFAYFSELEKAAREVGETADDEYRAATASIMPPVLAALVKGNEFGAADYIIKSRGDALGWDGPLLYARGELYRQRANPRDLATARGFFEQASTQPDAPFECWRGLGLTSLRLGDVTAGKAALAEYLRRAPEAGDAKSIKLVLEN